MLLTDDAPWPRYFYHDCSDLVPWTGRDILVYRYDHPAQKYPWLRWLDNDAKWACGFGSYQDACTYPELIPATREELVRLYNPDPRLFDNQGIDNATD